MVPLRDEAEFAVGLAVSGGVPAGVGVPRRVGALARRERVQELVQPRRNLARHRGDAERGKRDDVGVELAHPVDQAVATGVADEDVQARAAVRAVLVERVRVRGVVRRGLGLLALLVAVLTGTRDRHDVVGVQQVVAPPAPQRVLTRTAHEPVIAEVAEDRVRAVGPAVRQRRARAVRVVRHAAVQGRAFVRVQVEEPLVAGAGLVHTAVPVEKDRAPRVVLVVERELTQTVGDRAVVVPGVGVLAEVQQVARVERTAPVGAVGVRQAAARAPVVDLRVRVPDRLTAGDRVVARAAVQEVAGHAPQEAGGVRVVLGEATDRGRVVLDLSAEATEDHVIRGVRVEQRLVGPGGIRRDVERREVHGLLQVATHVDDRRLDVTRRRDPLVQEVSAEDRLVLGARSHRAEGSDAVQRLGEARARPGAGAGGAGAGPARRGVATGEDASVVAEDAVLADAAGEPVVAPAADDVVVIGVAVGHVAAAAEVDRVVAQFAVHLVVAEDLAPTGRVDAIAPGRVGDREEDAAVADGLAAAGVAGAGSAQVEPVRTEVRATGGVVEQVDTADHELLAAVGVVVDEAHVPRASDVASIGRIGGVVADIGPEGAGDPDDPAVVAHDRVGVGRVPVGRGRRTEAHAAVVIAGRVQAGAAEKEVRAVGTVVHSGQAEEVGGAAEDVVLAEVAEGDVVAAATLEVVLRRRVAASNDGTRSRSPTTSQVPAWVGSVPAVSEATQPSGLREAPTWETAACASSMPPSPWRMSSAQLAEHQVVVRTAGQVVVAPAAGARPRRPSKAKVCQRGVVDQVLAPTTAPHRGRGSREPCRR